MFARAPALQSQALPPPGHLGTTSDILNSASVLNGASEGRLVGVWAGSGLSEPLWWEGWPRRSELVQRPPGEKRPVWRQLPGGKKRALRYEVSLLTTGNRTTLLPYFCGINNQIS